MQVKYKKFVWTANSAEWWICTNSWIFGRTQSISAFNCDAVREELESRVNSIECSLSINDMDAIDIDEVVKVAHRRRIL
jgi:hypothetical protein